VGQRCFGYDLALSNRAYLPQEFLQPLKLNSLCGKKIESAKGVPLQFSAKGNCIKKIQHPQTFAITRLAGYLLLLRAGNMQNQARGCAGPFRKVGETMRAPGFSAGIIHDSTVQRQQRHADSAGPDKPSRIPK